MVLEIAGGILLALLVLRLIVGVIDGLDAWSSELSDEEARRRARLTLAGKWPPPDFRWLSVKQSIVAIIGLGLLWLASNRLR
jgi:hypothetical protein